MKRLLLTFILILYSLISFTSKEFNNAIYFFNKADKFESLEETLAFHQKTISELSKILSSKTTKMSTNLENGKITFYGYKAWEYAKYYPKLIKNILKIKEIKNNKFIKNLYLLESNLIINKYKNFPLSKKILNNSFSINNENFLNITLPATSYFNENFLNISLKYLKDIENNEIRDSIYEFISIYLLQKKQYEESLKFSKKIKREISRYYVYQKIAIEYLNIDINKTLEIVNLIDIDFIKDLTLEKIIDILLNNNNVDKALEFLNFIEDESDKSLALNHIGIFYLKQNNENYKYYLSKAYWKTKLIKNDYERDKAFKNIALDFLNNDLFVNSLDIAYEIKNNYIKYLLFKEISIYMFNKEKINIGNTFMNISLNSANSIENQNSRDFALEDLCLTEIKLNNIEDAIKILNTIKEEKYKDLVLSNLAIFYANTDLRKTYNFINKINDIKVKAITMGNVSVKIKDIAPTLSNKYLKKSLYILKVNENNYLKESLILNLFDLKKYENLELILKSIHEEKIKNAVIIELAKKILNTHTFIEIKNTTIMNYIKTCIFFEYSLKNTLTIEDINFILNYI
ncbi:hypothetical protein OSSY52_06120 [Tepiditoga spiralis]|uniref:Uncharacterized protein n=1 Tax=Tepiditoga spiralis TaxID=2108365 RepID=A0A7G1G2C3_9BACT|nr:hypothetical protein [Tepiditoga spiralis]BBE30471.1 hypothetical protein OSSY52_06120 [Tepiditoga spiralis]